MEVETVQYKEDGSHQTDVRRLLVSEMYGGGDVSVELQTLQQDPKLGFMPLVGAAMELKQRRETEERNQPISAIRCSQASSRTLSVQDVYAAVPDLEKVDEKWSIVLKPFFVQLFEQNAVFHTGLDGGEWIHISQAIFDCLTEDTATRKQVVDVLLAANIPVVTVPMYFLHALGKFTSHQPQKIMPTFVRATIRHHIQAYDSLDAAHKLLLLHYLLKDQDFRDLVDIKLLPLANGEFTYFSQSMETVFLANEECPRNLLPGLERRLLADDLSGELMQIFTKVASEGSHQLRHLNPHVMVDLIKKVIPKSWYKTGALPGPDAGHQHPSRDWLERLWIYLCRQHPTDLTPFLDLPILPLGEDKVVPLTLPSMVIMRSEFGVELSPGLCHCLELVGVTVVDGLADHVRYHAAVVGSFVRPPMPKNVVDAILTASIKNDVITVFRDHTKEAEKLELLELIGNIGSESNEERHKEFLRTLPLFKSTHSTPEQPQFVSAAEVKKAHASHSIVTLMESFIDVSTSEAMSAATTLGVEILDDVSFIKYHVLSEMRNSGLKPEDVQKCMHYVFDNIQMLQRVDPQILQHFIDISFVTTKGGQLVSSNSVYDPTDGTLQKLFVGENNHFPSGFYDSPETLVILRKMGMKTSRDVSAHDILSTATHIETMSNTLANDKRHKAETLLMFLANFRSDLLQKAVNGQLLLDWLKDLAWVPVCIDMPEQFPVGLKINAGEVFRTAADVKSYDWACIVGSVVPIVRCRAKENISTLFGWDRPPSLADIVRQFTLLVASYSYDATADYTVVVRSTYDALSAHPLSAVRDALEAAELREWVWHGEGFTTVERALLQRPPLTLKPYVYALTPGLQRFHTLLSGCGVRRQCSSDVLVDVLHHMKAKYDKSDPEQVAGASDRGSGVAQATTKTTDPKRRNNDVPSHSFEEIESDLRLTNDILNHIKSLPLPASVLSRVLVPADVEGTVRLLPASDCAYCDVEWLRKGLDSMEFDETDGIVLTHHHLPTSTAAALGVPTLMSRMLHAEELAITSFGQGEPLTNTLRRMLEDYTDGLAIPKELVQNADDAGATEVHFMYDERIFGVGREFLFGGGMGEWSGPGSLVLQQLDVHRQRS
ncbi:Sacsin [Lamellibrachia satsuma]|nr:Sacsin [Lamellibrachia satsuma]